MLHELLEQYLVDIERAIKQLRQIYVEKFEEEIIAANRINLRFRLRFASGKLIEVNESVIIDAGKLKHLGYRYHCQDQDNQLLFRYDNTPHFPNLENFPHHKHLPGEVVGCEQPVLVTVIHETDSHRPSHTPR